MPSHRGSLQKFVWLLQPLCGFTSACHFEATRLGQEGGLVPGSGDPSGSSISWTGDGATVVWLASLGSLEY